MTFLIISIICISVVGTLGHFLYELSNHNKYIGLFAAVNESVWEHIKIALTPTFLWGLIDGYIFGINPNYFFAKALCLIVIIVVMPLIYYVHKFITGKDSLVFDIISFYIVIILSQLAFHHALDLAPISFNVYYLSCVVMFIIFGSYMVLSLLPFKNFIFKDPITKKYGYKGHSHE